MKKIFFSKGLHNLAPHRLFPIFFLLTMLFFSTSLHGQEWEDSKGISVSTALTAGDEIGRIGLKSGSFATADVTGVSFTGTGEEIDLDDPPFDGNNISDWITPSLGTDEIILTVSGTGVPSGFADDSGCGAVESAFCSAALPATYGNNGCIEFYVRHSGISSNVPTTFYLCIYEPTAGTIDIDPSDLTTTFPTTDTYTKTFSVTGGAGGDYNWSFTMEDGTSFPSNTKVSINNGSTFQPISGAMGGYTLSAENIILRSTSSSETNFAYKAHATKPSGGSPPSTPKISHSFTEDDHPPIDALDIVFVLDISGSMGNPGICEGEKRTEEKIEFLKTGVLAVINELEAKEQNMPRRTRVGVVTFNSSPTVKSFGPNVPPFKLDAGTAELSNVVEWFRCLTGDKTSGCPPYAAELNDSGSTNMGGGLKEAIDILKDASPPSDDPVEINRKKFIILFTNGMQNKNPRLRSADQADGSKLYYIDVNNNYSFDSGTDYPIKQQSLLPGGSLYDIQIISVALYEPNDAAHLEVLKGIAGESAVNNRADHKFFIYTCELVEALEKAVMTALGFTNTPKIVEQKRQKMSGTQIDEEFTITEKGDKLIINICTVNDANISYTLSKKISGTYKVISKNNHFVIPVTDDTKSRALSIDFPLEVSGSDIGIPGDYKIEIKSDQADIEYNATTIIDNSGVKFKTSTGPGNVMYKTGDHIDLGVELRFDGVPVTNATVKALVLKPGESMSNALAKAKMPGQYVTSRPRNFEFSRKKAVSKSTVISDEVVTTPRESNYSNPFVLDYSITPPDGVTFESRLTDGQKKYNVLLYATDYLDNIDINNFTVNLDHIGNGIYKAHFTDTKEVGLYRVIFQIEGNIPEFGNYKRVDEKAVTVSFGKPELSKSKLFMLSEEPLLMTMTPKDEYDNLLGTNQSDEIEFSLARGYIGSPTDNLDGRYSYLVSGVPKGLNPEIIIRVSDEVLYKGPLYGINRRRASLTLQGGYAAPMGDFDNLYDPGSLIQGRFGYRFSPTMGVNVGGGIYNFKETATANNYSIWSTTLGLSYTNNFPSGGLHLLVDLNGGYYKPDDIDGELGANLGVGISRDLLPWLSVNAESRYHRVFANPEIDFLGISGGISIHF